MVKKIFLGLVILLVLAAGGFVFWASSSQGPSQEALLAMKSGGGVAVESSADWTVFRPQDVQPEVGLIFYPGGRVDTRSYAPLLSMIARRGYQVVVVAMPLNLAVFGVEKAQQVIAAFPQVKAWAIGGHSLGGSMAAQFAINHPGVLRGLVFWAAYPPSSMAGRSDLQITLISASHDGLSTPDKIEASRQLLPRTTDFVVISGGNHAQFGSYGDQPGDNPATIAPASQWQQVVDATAALLGKLAK